MHIFQYLNYAGMTNIEKTSDESFKKMCEPQHNVEKIGTFLYSRKIRSRYTSFDTFSQEAELL